MSQPVIKIESLSKRYRIGLKEKKKDTLFGQIGSVLRAPIDNFRHLRSLSHFTKEDESIFWALRDINFEVHQGEVLGIIGHNGAGKSTLLKILSRITEPTDGQITIKGRIGALLEVGTGFHPELTGRDNIYMNGTILGMSRKEINYKLDEIVDFSGVETYIDTPVKFYSSGMKVRLGFAVAAHLEPEILLIDEVLAVGDIGFQKKCIGKIEDITSKSNRTILFVSHSMSIISNICNRVVVLKDGYVNYNGNITEGIKKYFEAFKGENLKNTQNLNSVKRRGSGHYRFKNIEIKNNNGVATQIFDVEESIFLSLSIKRYIPINELHFIIGFKTGDAGHFVASSEKIKLPHNKEEIKLEIEINNKLRTGEYPLYFWLGDDNSAAYDVLDNVLSPIIISTQKSFEYLGYNPAAPLGFFSLKSKIKQLN